MRQYCTGASQEVVTSSQTKSDAMTVKLTSKKIQDTHSCPTRKFRRFGSHVNICGDSNETVSTIASATISSYSDCNCDSNNGCVCSSICNTRFDCLSVSASTTVSTTASPPASVSIEQKYQRNTSVSSLVSPHLNEIR